MSNILDAALAADDATPVPAETTPAETSAPQSQTAPQAPESPAEPQVQPRAPDGKFAPKALTEAAAAAPAADAAQSAPATPPAIPAAPAPSGEVPYQALIEERFKRQELEARIKAFEDAEAKRKADAAANATPPPAFADDPEGFIGSLQQRFEQQLYEQRFALQQQFAEEKHGAEKVKEVMEWAHARAEADPIFNQQALAHPNPIEFAVTAHREHELLGQIRDTGIKADELARFRAWQAAQAAQPDPAQPAPIPQQPAPQAFRPPPATIANAPNAGGVTSVAAAPGTAFAAHFGPSP